MLIGIPLQAATFHPYGRLHCPWDEIAYACLSILTPVVPGAPPHG